MLIVVVTIGVGAEIGQLLVTRLTFIPEGLIALICVGASSFLIWPIYRLLRLMPPLPGCPNGHGVNWVRSANQGDFPSWSCRACGLLIRHRMYCLDVFEVND